MPKYHVYLHETRVYEFDLKASDQEDAGRIAKEMFAEDTSQSPTSFDTEVSEVLELSDDAAVENDG